MFPTGDYERFEHEIGSVYRDYDIPITYGILIADMRQPACAEHIVNYLNRFHRLSNKYFDFFIPGYSFYGYRNGKKLDSCIDGKSLFFSDELFDEFVQKIEEILDKLEDEKMYGAILRAKGMVPAGDGTWINFDYVPGESNVRKGAPEVTGKICVIGAKLNEENLKELFNK